MSDEWRPGVDVSHCRMNAYYWVYGKRHEVCEPRMLMCVWTEWDGGYFCSIQDWWELDRCNVMWVSPEIVQPEPKGVAGE